MARYSDPVSRMVNVYKEWHQKLPKRVLTKAAPLPERMFRVGLATDILYSSDKWEKDGAFFDYIHEFSDPYIWAPSPLFDDQRVTKSTAVLLGVPSIKGDIPLVQLAKVKTILGKDGDEELSFEQRGKTLCSTLDKRAVIVCDGQNSIIIRGGRMRVTERGIVK